MLSPPKEEAYRAGGFQEPAGGPLRMRIEPDEVRMVTFAPPPFKLPDACWDPERRVMEISGKSERIAVSSRSASRAVKSRSPLKFAGTMSVTSPPALRMEIP